MAPVKLQEENCSAFGRLVLQYLKENPQISMNQLAKQIGISHAGLSWICLQQNSPSEETAKKIAAVIGADLIKVARMVHENRLESLANLNALNYSVKTNQGWVTRRIPIEDAIAALNSIYHSFQYIVRTVPEIEKPSDFQIYKQSYEIITRQFLKQGGRLLK